LSIFGYGSLWAYASVFAGSVSEVVDCGPVLEPYYSYFIFLAIFALFVIPLTCMELTEQVTRGGGVIVVFVVGPADRVQWSSSE